MVFAPAASLKERSRRAANAAAAADQRHGRFKAADCFLNRNALRSIRDASEVDVAAAERMRAMRERRRRRGLRELRLVVPDPRLRSVRRRVAAEVAVLDPRNEAEALAWIEAVSEFDTPPNGQ